MKDREPYKIQPLVADEMCGPAALSAALESVGIEANQIKLAMQAHWDSDWGTDIGGMEKAASEYCHPQTMEDSQYKLGMLGMIAPLVPVIVDIMDGDDHANDGHYCLLDDVVENRVFIFDPSQGTRVFHKEDFINHWFDFDRDGEKVEGWSMTLW